MAPFRWLSGGSDGATRRVAQYADECFVHAGAPGTLSRAQRDENLSSFVASIDRRVSRLRALAAELGTILPVPVGDRGQVEAIGRALDGFCKDRLSGLKFVEPALAMDWRAREPQGRDRQAQTLAIDLGTYCGEVARSCAPRYLWAIDEARYTPATIMETSGRVVIGHDPGVNTERIRNPVDVIAIAAFALTQIVHCRSVRAKGLWRPNYFHFLNDLAAGRYE